VQWRVVDREPSSGEAPPARPGYYLTGVDLEEFGADGKRRIGLQSISANEDPCERRRAALRRRRRLQRADGPVWHLTSNEARVPPGGRVVEFEGDVRLTGRPGDGPVPAELYAARLSLDTEAEKASTRSSVELVFGTHRMRALGMDADLKAGTVHLNSDVNGRFVQ
jgi:LPS export ABC transporter protein LptC